jgi:hypothetical protein
VVLVARLLWWNITHQNKKNAPEMQFVALILLIHSAEHSKQKIHLNINKKITL